jgi:hypothetical protein
VERSRAACTPGSGRGAGLGEALLLGDAVETDVAVECPEAEPCLVPEIPTAERVMSGTRDHVEVPPHLADHEPRFACSARREIIAQTGLVKSPGTSLSTKLSMRSIRRSMLAMLARRRGLPVRSCATSSKSSGLAVASFVMAPVSAPSCSVIAPMVTEAVFCFRSYRAAVGPRHAPHRRAHCHRIPRPNLVL